MSDSVRPHRWQPTCFQLPVCCQEPTLESESPEFQSSALIITSHFFLSGISKEICFNYRCYFCPGLCHTCISSHRCLCIWWFPQALPLQGEVLFLLFPSSCPEGISVSLDRGSGGGTMQLFFSPSLFFLTALLRRQPKSQSGLSFGPEESGKEAGKCGGDAREKRVLLWNVYT